MQDLEVELFRLGIPAKTRHNEVAPNQFELAPIYEPANVAADHNQLLMEVMRKVGERNGLAVLLGEKPFAGVNGSGKHNNWSLGCDDGTNLLDPGQTPEENLQFLYFLCAVLRGVHKHGALLRAAIASASNDHRLGANEAPPAVMSVFLGEQLGHILDQIERGELAGAAERKQLDLGLAKLPMLAKDSTDRNRTSPFAFTGNKFEFRAVGAGQAIAVPLCVINTVVGDALCHMNQLVEARESGGSESSRRKALLAVIRDTIAESKAVRFDGNGYSKEWLAEAERRGLPHAKNTVEALRTWEDPPVQEMFARAGVMTKEEQDARVHVRHEQYVKVLHIEAQVLREMAETQILPAVVSDVQHRAAALLQLQQSGCTVPEPLRAAVQAEADLLGEGYKRLAALREAITQVTHAESEGGMHAHSAAFATVVIPAQQSLRESLDALEEMCDAQRWPLPKYREMLAPLS